MNHVSIDAIGLGQAILMALPLEVRAGGFPTATHVVCSRPDYDALTKHPVFRLETVEDERGVIADRLHSSDRSPDASAAFDRLASTELHLDRLAAVDDRIEPDNMYTSPYDTTFWFADNYAIPDHEGWIAADEDEDISDVALHASLEGRPTFGLEELRARIRKLIEDGQAARSRMLDDFLQTFPGRVWQTWPMAAEVELRLEDGGDSGNFYLRVLKVRDVDGKELPDVDDHEPDLGLDELTESHGEELDGATITLSGDGLSSI